MARSFIVLWLVFTLANNELEASPEVVRGITSSFIKVLDQCKRELNLGAHILTDLYHFWKEDVALQHRDTGCAIVCMSSKLDLLDASGQLHHGTAQEFAMKNGAAEEVAVRLVTQVHQCEQQHRAQVDDCLRALDVAMCFRNSLRQLAWIPNMEVLVSDLLTEI